MYCPSCGSNNQPDIKFCTRCGTNLGVVSEALTGKISGKSGSDDRTRKLLRDYYSGRRDAITGAILIPAALLILGLMTAAGLKPLVAFFIICWMFFWAAGALAGGLGKWIASKSELKTLGYDFQGQFHGVPLHSVPQENQPQLPDSGFSTAPVGYPGSVTDHTTRQLDERGYLPPEREQETSR